MPRAYDSERPLLAMAAWKGTAIQKVLSSPLFWSALVEYAVLWVLCTTTLRPRRAIQISAALNYAIGLQGSVLIFQVCNASSR